jgi:hypothetical protein
MSLPLVGNLNEKKLAVAAAGAERVFKILRSHQTAHLEYFLGGALGLSRQENMLKPREPALLLLREAVWLNPRT